MCLSDIPVALLRIIIIIIIIIIILCMHLAFLSFNLRGCHTTGRGEIPSSGINASLQRSEMVLCVAEKERIQEYDVCIIH